MLYMKGMGFDAIAKWIGHASPAVTSGVYGRLSQTDVAGMLRGVPFVDEGERTDVRAQWTKIARFITQPYVFDDDELPSRAQPGPGSSHKQAVSAAAERAGFTGRGRV